MTDVFSSVNSRPKLRPLIALIAAISLAACSSDDEDAGEGYLQTYNLLHNATGLEVNLTIDDDETTLAYLDAFDAHSQVLLDSDDYPLGLSVPVSIDTTQDIHQASYAVSNDKVTFVVASGDVQNPQFTSFNYEYEDPETDDDVFTFRVINTSTSNQNLDVYISEDDKSFSDAQLVATTSLMSLSDSQYFDTGSYKFYFTESGTDNIVYQSDDINFLYTNQQMLLIRDAQQPTVAPVTLDIVSTSGAVNNYQHIEQLSNVRFYNGISNHELMPEYNNQLNLLLNQNGTQTPYLLGLGQASSEVELDFGDYAISLMNENSEKLENDQILSVMGGSDETVFYYLTEVESASDDDDEDTETEVYLNYIQTSASDNLSIHSHNLQVLNFVSEYPNLQVYFVGTGESIATTNNQLSAIRSYSAQLELFNDQYDVFVMANENGNEFLIANTSLTLDEDSDNNYIIIELNSAGQYQINQLPQ